MQIIAVGNYQWGKYHGVLNFRFFAIGWVTGNWCAKR
jgi:hypothetical protein